LKKRLNNRPVPIILLILFAGWLFLIPLGLYFQLRSESNVFTSSIDFSQGNPEVMEIKIGLAIPYSSEWASPQQSEGLLEYNGEFYTLISTDYKNDTLYFKYLKNQGAREIFSKLADHVDPLTHKKGKDRSAQNSIGRWMSMKYLNVQQFSTQVVAVRENEMQKNYCYKNLYSFKFHRAQSPPPKLI
jgi:hypothetical protein